MTQKRATHHWPPPELLLPDTLEEIERGRLTQQALFPEPDPFTGWVQRPDCHGRMGWEAPDGPKWQRLWARGDFEDFPEAPGASPENQNPPVLGRRRVSSSVRPEFENPLLGRKPAGAENTSHSQTPVIPLGSRPLPLLRAITPFWFCGHRIERNDHQRLDDGPGVVFGADNNAPRRQSHKIPMRDWEGPPVGQPDEKRLERLAVEYISNAGNIHSRPHKNQCQNPRAACATRGHV